MEFIDQRVPQGFRMDLKFPIFFGVAEVRGARGACVRGERGLQRREEGAVGFEDGRCSQVGGGCDGKG